MQPGGRGIPCSLVGPVDEEACYTPMSDGKERRDGQSLVLPPSGRPPPLLAPWPLASFVAAAWSLLRIAAARHELFVGPDHSPFDTAMQALRVSSPGALRGGMRSTSAPGASERRGSAARCQPAAHHTHSPSARPQSAATRAPLAAGRSRVSGASRWWRKEGAALRRGDAPGAGMRCAPGAARALAGAQCEGKARPRPPLPLASAPPHPRVPSAADRGARHGVAQPQRRHQEGVL